MTSNDSPLNVPAMRPPVAPASDAEFQALVTASHRSTQALGEILELCRRYLLQIANSELDSQLHNKMGASDVVQETFLEAQRIFDRFAGDSPEALRAWLRAILINKMATLERQYRGTAKRDVDKEVHLDADGNTHVQPFVPTPSPSNVLMQRERAVQLQAAIARLPPDYRQIIVWRQVEDLSFEEIAARLQRSLDATRKLWWRAIQKLQDELPDVQ